MKKQRTQSNLISRQSQEETTKSPCESARNTICDWKTETGRFGVGDLYSRERKYKKFWWHRPRPVFKCRHNLLNEVKSWPPSRRKILNSLILLSSKHKFVYIGQTALGKMAGCSREVANRQLKCLEEDGLVFNNYRHKKTSIYRLASLFKMKRMKRKLGKLLPALLVSVMLMVTQTCKVFSSKLNNKIISSNKTQLTYNRKNASQEKDGILTKWAKSSRYVPPEFRKYGGTVMTKEEISSIVKAVEEVSNTLDLTKFGKASLSIYPDSALRRAHDNLIKTLKRGNRIREPFNYLCKLAHKETNDRGLSVNYYLFNKCDGHYQFTDNEEPLNSRKISIPKDNMSGSTKCNPRIPTIWNKKADNYNLEKELSGYETTQQSNHFKDMCKLFGEEVTRKLFKRCKHNVITKAMQCSQ